MKIVKLIDDNWDKKDAPEWVKNVLIVGDQMPELNQEYVVHSTYYDNSKKTAYILEGFEHLKNYDGGWFKVERFEDVSDIHTPNAFIEICGSEFLAEKVNIIAKLDFDLPDKKQDIIEITTFIKEE